jgi:hypothetical protein
MDLLANCFVILWYLKCKLRIFLYCALSSPMQSLAVCRKRPCKHRQWNRFHFIFLWWLRSNWLWCIRDTESRILSRYGEDLILTLIQLNFLTKKVVKLHIHLLFSLYFPLSLDKASILFCLLFSFKHQLTR